MENYKTFGTLMDTKHNPAWKKIRQLSDEVCKEMGLSVVAYEEIGKGVSHYEWTKQQQGLSWKENSAMNWTVSFSGLIHLRIFLKSAD